MTGRAAVAPTATGRAGMTAATATTTAAVAPTATGRACVTTATAATTWRTGMTAATWRTGMTAATTTGRARVAAATGRTGMTAATAATATTGRTRVSAAVGCDCTGDGEGQCGDHHACAGGSQQSTACDLARTGSATHRGLLSSCRRRLARRIGAMRPEACPRGSARC